jgi:hypothetical protein
MPMQTSVTFGVDHFMGLFLLQMNCCPHILYAQRGPLHKWTMDISWMALPNKYPHLHPPPTEGNAGKIKSHDQTTAREGWDFDGVKEVVSSTTADG